MKVSLTPGETFHLWRRQLGISRSNAADMFGVKSRTIWNWEHDRARGVPNVFGELPSPLPPWTQCYILRRRLGMSVRTFAKTFGVSFQELSRWENGQNNWERLVEYFEKLGWEIR